MIRKKIHITSIKTNRKAGKKWKTKNNIKKNIKNRIKQKRFGTKLQISFIGRGTKTRTQTCGFGDHRANH